MSGVMGYGLSGLGGGLQAAGEKAATDSWLAAQNAADLAVKNAPDALAGQVAELSPFAPNTPVLGSQYLGDVVKGAQTVDPMQFAKDNWKYLGAAGLGAAGMMSPQQAGAAGPQAKTGYAPRYTWNPQTRRYEDAPAMPYTYYRSEEHTSELQSH